VRDVRTGVIGAVVGEGEGNQLDVEDVNVGERVKKGDALVTSGLSVEHFPSGIPVGKVTSVFSSAGDLQLVMSAQPLADIVNLQFVQVLLWSSQSG
jgi:rod shape-determining protein MreC